MRPIAQRPRDALITAERTRWAVLAAALLIPAAVATAQTYPSKPVRWIVPFPPGGSVDAIARRLGPALTSQLGQQFVIDNRSGASGNIGTEAVARSAPDGYTLLSNTVPFVVNTFLYSRVPYDVVNDFAPVSWLASTASVMTVHPSLPVRTVRELLQMAKARPGALNYASAGIGTNPHIAGELFNYLGKVNIVAVQFKGGAPARMSAIAGEIPITITSVLETAPQIKAGRLRALGVTSVKRSIALPDVPTIAESGLPGYEFNAWHVLVAPKGTPAAVTNLLRDRIKSAVASPEVVRQLEDQGLELVVSTPEELGTLLKGELAKWGKVVKERGMRAE
jgi:tripartite-type tricarboxylate transporter receptor subunit TctC